MQSQRMRDFKVSNQKETQRLQPWAGGRREGGEGARVAGQQGPLPWVHLQAGASLRTRLQPGLPMPMGADLAPSQARCGKTTLPFLSLMESPGSARLRCVYKPVFWYGLDLQPGRGHGSFERKQDLQGTDIPREGG